MATYNFNRTSGGLEILVGAESVKTLGSSENILFSAVGTDMLGIQCGSFVWNVAISDIGEINGDPAPATRSEIIALLNALGIITGGGGGGSAAYVQEFVGTGVQTNFTTAHTIVLVVSLTVANVPANSGDFETSGTTLSFNSAPDIGEIIRIAYQ